MNTNENQAAEKAQLPAYRRAARSQPCSRCEAAAGRPCREPSGRVTYEHRVRYDITRLAQEIGYEEGLREALDLIDWQVGKHGASSVAQVRESIERERERVAASVKRDEAALSERED